MIADRFFQAAFGGSFLNHQWLVAAATPTFRALADGRRDQHSIVDANGMPTQLPALHAPTGAVSDAPLTVAVRPAAARPGSLCGDFAVNTIQPAYQPYAPGRDGRRLPPQTAPTIGDRLSAEGVDWAWYSGGWSNANGDVDAPGWTNGTGPAPCTDPDTLPAAVFPNCPNKLFQFHHQPLNYYASFAPGTPARAAHLRDEAEFIAAGGSRQQLPAQAGQLHQADRRRERAPRLRERAHRQRPPGRPAPGHRDGALRRRTRWSS